MVGFLIGNDRIEASNRLTCIRYARHSCFASLDYEHHTWQKVHEQKKEKQIRSGIRIFIVFVDLFF